MSGDLKTETVLQNTTVRLPETLHYRMQTHCMRKRITQQEYLQELLDSSLPKYTAELNEVFPEHTN